MKAMIVIPARMGATRFPGKPLAKIAGLSMIAHCYLRASYSKLANQIYVATCDEVIANEIERLGGKVIFTSDQHERASDRTAEAMLKLEQQGLCSDIIVMLQGDEPLIRPTDLDQLIEQHQRFPHVAVFNLTQHIADEISFHSSNTVKILTNLNGEVLVFSREPLPSPRLKGLLGYKPKKQLGIMSFKRDALYEFYQLPPTQLEKIESIDMMRLLEHGRMIKEIVIDSFMIGVDTIDDAMIAEKHLLLDDLYQQYKHKVA